MRHIASLAAATLLVAVGAQAQGFGSYIAIVSGTNLTFQNYAQDNCVGAFTTFSSPLNQCGVFFDPNVNMNFSWSAIANETNCWYANYPSTDCTGSSLWTRLYELNACGNCPNKECKFGPLFPAQGPLAILKRQQPWLENQWHVGVGQVLVTSMSAGKLMRVDYHEDDKCISSSTCAANTTDLVMGVKSVTGVVFDRVTRMAFALVTHAQDQDGYERNSLIEVNPWSKKSNDYKIVWTAGLDTGLFGNLTLNGLAKHEKANVFYATSLGNFTEGYGFAAVFDAETGVGQAFAVNLTAADGAFVYHGKLYFSEVFSAMVHVYDVSNATNPIWLRSYQAPGLKSLDDFFVDEYNGVERIFGADWGAGEVRSWNADGTGASSVHAVGLVHPTSVRPELDKAGRWNKQYVTVTEGGSYPVANPKDNGARFYRMKLKGEFSD